MAKNLGPQLGRLNKGSGGGAGREGGGGGEALFNNQGLFKGLKKAPVWRFLGARNAGLGYTN